jgi:hypothetical protein
MRSKCQGTQAWPWAVVADEGWLGGWRCLLLDTATLRMPAAPGADYLAACLSIAGGMY